MQPNEIVSFDNPEFGNVRTIENNGKVLFHGNDVAAALGYSNTNKAIRNHCKGCPFWTPPFFYYMKDNY